MMQSADLRQCNHRPKIRRLHRTTRRRVLFQRQVRPSLVIMLHVRLHVSAQRLLVENDHVVDALVPNRPNHPLDVGPLPGRTRRREHFFDAHMSDLLSEVGAEDTIPIAQKISRRLLKADSHGPYSESVYGLPSTPAGGRVGRGELSKSKTVEIPCDATR